MKHGTVYAYRKLKCHCDECRASHAEQMRGYRDRRRARTMTSRADFVRRIEALEVALADLIESGAFDLHYYEPACGCRVCRAKQTLEGILT